MNNFGTGCSGHFHTLTKRVIEQKQNVQISMSQLLTAHQACSDLARKYISQLIGTPSSLMKKKALQICLAGFNVVNLFLRHR
jgi:hypothetical protein